MPKVSIIVPVYNVQDYLEACLESILVQSFIDFEVLCIDDGSTDNSPQILADYAKRDQRIKVIRQGNGGLSVARDAALPYVRGKYIAFVDADDYVLPSYLEKTVSAAEEYNIDILVFAHKSYDCASGLEQPLTGTLKVEQLPNQAVFNCHDIPDRIFNLTTPAVWDKLYRADFILDHPLLRFGTFKRTEDYPFTYTALSLANRIAAIDESLYVYRINRPGSLLTERPADPLSFFEPFRLLYENLKELDLYDELLESYTRRVSESTLWEMHYIKDSAALDHVVAFLESQGFEQLGISCIWPVGQYDAEEMHNYFGTHQTNIINIVVLMTADLEDFERFLSDLAMTNMSYRVIVIDNASQDQRIQGYLKAQAKENTNFVTVRNEVAQSFAACANQGFAMAQGHIVLIDPRMQCPARWLERLVIPLLYKSSVASVTPYTNTASAISYPTWWINNFLPEGFGDLEVDQAFAELAPVNPQCLGGHELCMALNRRVILSMGGFDEQLEFSPAAAVFDWCMRAEGQGFLNIIADNLYMYKQGAAEVAAESLKEQLINELASKHPHIRAYIESYEQWNPAHSRKDRVTLKLALLKLERELSDKQNELIYEQSEVLDKQNELLMTNEELDYMRNSFSWRLTKPLRAIRNLLAGNKP